MNEVVTRRAILTALGATGNVNNEREFNAAFVNALEALIATGIADAIASKTEIAALTGGSTAADIVTALKA